MAEASIITAAAAVLGTSIATAKLIDDLHSRVATAITIYNVSKFELRIVGAMTRGCHIRKNITAINPAAMEVILCEQSWPHKGIECAAVFKVSTLEVYFVVHWKAPVTFIRSKNWLRVAFIAEYTNMRTACNGEGGKSFHTENLGPLDVKKYGVPFRVRATMGDSHKCEVGIQFVPTNSDNVAASLTHAIRSFAAIHSVSKKKRRNMGGKRIKRKLVSPHRRSPAAAAAALDAAEQ
jgi:hypothetical protein